MMLIFKRENITYIHILILVVTVFGVFRNILEYKDLQSGDTASYFQRVIRWNYDGMLNIAWSPLYTSTLVFFEKITSHAYYTLIGLRFTIVILIGVLLYFIFRQMLSATGGLLLSIWWIILPINYDSVYSVHLFAIILPLITLLLSASKKIDVRLKDILIFSILLVSTILVRNEHLLILVGWTFFILSIQLMNSNLIDYLKGFRVVHISPVAIGLLMIIFCYEKSFVKGNDLKNAMDSKHVLNVCQIYSYNQQQHGDTWSKSPWTECQDMMIRDFGKALPTMKEAFLLNSDAMIQHFLYNLFMVPDGIQLGLFNGYSGKYNPDYIPAKRSLSYIIFFSISIILIIIFVKQKSTRNVKKILGFINKENFKPILLLLLFSLATLVVIIMQRPRPSYMFLMNISLMALIINSLNYIITSCLSIKKASQVLFFFIGIIALGGIFKNVYSEEYINFPAHSKGQWLKNAYERFNNIPEFNRISKEDKISISLTIPNDALGMYLGKQINLVNIYDIFQPSNDSLTIAQNINNQQSDYYYLDSERMDQSSISLITNILITSNYDINATGYDKFGQWRIYKRKQ